MFPAFGLLVSKVVLIFGPLGGKPQVVLIFGGVLSLGPVLILGEGFTWGVHCGRAGEGGGGSTVGRQHARRPASRCGRATSRAQTLPAARSMHLPRAAKCRGARRCWSAWAYKQAGANPASKFPNPAQIQMPSWMLQYLRGFKRGVDGTVVGVPDSCTPTMDGLVDGLVAECFSQNKNVQ